MVGGNVNRFRSIAPRPNNKRICVVVNSEVKCLFIQVYHLYRSLTVSMSENGGWLEEDLLQSSACFGLSGPCLYFSLKI